MSEKETRRPGAGRPRKPTKHKKLAGTLQPCRTNTKEPKRPCISPPQSFALGPEGKKAWKILADIIGPEGMRISTQADIFAMTMFCQSWAGYMGARKELQKTGAAYKSYEEKMTNKAGKPANNGKHPGGKPKTKSGKVSKVMWKIHPLAKLAGEERAFIVSMLSKFGLTPADRSRVDEILEDDTTTAEGKVIKIGKARRTG